MTTDAGAITFDDEVRRILDGKNFAAVSTLNPDGAPQTSLVWFKRDGDTVLFSTTTGRQKARNLARDPRISLGIFDIGNPYNFVEIRGRAELVEETTDSLRAELSDKYLGEDPRPDPEGVTRVVVRVVPAKLNRFTA